MKLFDSDKANNYRANAATFSPTDELVLNDGVLWDVRSRKPLHKFDKFNQYISGVFHPMGQEIIINSEVVSFNYEAEAAFATHVASAFLLVPIFIAQPHVPLCSFALSFCSVCTNTDELKYICLPFCLFWSA